MNKILLSFGAAMIALSSFAQTNSISSGNGPVNNGEGYTFEFNNSPAANCSEANIPNAGIAYAGITVDSVGNGSLYVRTDTSKIKFAYANLALRLSSGNCDDYSFDMSTKAAQRIEIKIKTSVALKEFKVLLMDGAGLSNDSLNLTAANLPAGADTILVFDEIDFHQYAEVATDEIDKSDITNVLLYFRDAWDKQVAGTFEIDYIKLGNTLVGLSNKAKESSISVYPNPASTSVNFEKELQNVTIYNIVGTQVYQAAAATTVDVSSFQAGVYYIQHAEGTSRFTVQ